jgi:hypothetical protein
MKDSKDFIFKSLRETCSAGESAKVYIVVDVKTGKSELVIEKTISERYPVQKLEEVERLYERITGGGGRRLWKLEELV